MAVSGVRSSKAELRADFLAVRSGLTPGDIAETEAVFAQRVMELPELAEVRTVGAYVSVGREPGTRALLDRLRARGVRVLLPALREDNDLAWGVYEGAQRLAKGRRGLLEPQGTRLGPQAVLEVDTLLLPGLAVDARGMRLGRGGGSYDRVLARLAACGADPVRVVLLYDNEVVARVPAEPHDHPVHAVVTPRGVRRFPSAPGGLAGGRGHGRDTRA